MRTRTRPENRSILRHLPTILGWCDPEDRERAPVDWCELDIEYREFRIKPCCMICGDPSGFCRVVEMDDGREYWADLCSEHTDPGHLLGLS